ncbi:MAG: type IX secretion system membrane protein PorP/SprF [Bacteroidia bacterium]
MKRIVTLMGLLAFSFSSFAQQELQISQYMFNGLFLNPAYAGTHPYWGATLLHRSQWVSFPGAPRTNLLAVDGPIKGKNMGLGFMITNDNIGLTQINDISGSYSYRIKTGTKGGQLSFGIRAGVRNQQFNISDLQNIPDAGDPLYNANQSVWTPRFDFGMYYYTERGYLGLSIPSVIAIDSRTVDNTDAGLRRHFYLNGGYVWKLSNSIDFKPSFLMKYEPTAPLSADINAHFLFNERFWLGVSYRYDAAVVGMAQFQITPNLRAGYAYDYTTSDIRQFQNGSHEIMIGYDFTQKLVKIKNPRYF